MVHGTRHAFLPQPARRRSQDPRTPHPSWREVLVGRDHASTRIVSAGDFWERLGV